MFEGCSATSGFDRGLIAATRCHSQVHGIETLSRSGSGLDASCLSFLLITVEVQMTRCRTSMNDGHCYYWAASGTCQTPFRLIARLLLYLFPPCNHAKKLATWSLSILVDWSHSKCLAVRALKQALNKHSVAFRIQPKAFTDKGCNFSNDAKGARSPK